MSTLAALLLFSILQAPLRVTGVVIDASGAPVAGAVVRAEGTTTETRTGTDGAFVLDVQRQPQRLVVTAPGFSEHVVALANGSGPLRIVLEVRGISESLTVTAGSAGARLSTPASVTALDGETLATAAPLAVDDVLRGVPGFSLFRRSSSRVANPTTQGVTLRGMAASGASRATVLVDDQPMTDAFGGWIQWNRMPAAALSRVEVARGGASDLFGGDAVGGAITLSTARTGARIFADAGSDGTARASVFGGTQVNDIGIRGGVERFTTDGYVIVAPESAGPIDTRANSRHTTLYGGADRAWTGTAAGVQAGYVRESRGNGTPFQTNATKTAHASGRVSGTRSNAVVSARVYVASTDYEQTFSAILAGRESERPTSAQTVESSTLGGSVEWLQPWRGATLLVSASGRRASADLEDQPLSTPAPVDPNRVDARQGTAAITAQVSWPITPRVTAAGGLRAERWTSRRDGQGAESTVNAGPRASIVFAATPSLTLRASLQSGYRFPTINELYRDFRVGNALTQANAGLQPEESLGAEGSALYRQGRLTLRVAAFSTSLSDAIVNVTLSTSPSLILRQRRNAASIRSRGVDVEADVRLGRILHVTASTAYVDSTFRSGEGLEGLRVPQVPRVQAAAGAHAVWQAANASVEWRFTSGQYDDDRNQFLLERAGLVNARAGWRLARGLEVFAAVENAFDVDQDVGRTPIRTIGLPRTARFGVRVLR